MGCGAMSWRDHAAGSERDGGLHRAWVRRSWTPWEIAAMVIGFVVFWPVGLAILLWILWSKRYGAPPLPLAWLGRVAGGGLGPSGISGNSAFEDWKRSELERLEQERRRLAEAEQEFAAFLDQLKRARDREEFDRFMAARTAPPAQ